jgi:hypothetical protein
MKQSTFILYIPYDKPDPLNFVEIKVLKVDAKKANYTWKWGRLKPTRRRLKSTQI